MAILKDENKNNISSFEIVFGVGHYDYPSAEWATSTITLTFAELIPPVTFEFECGEFIDFAYPLRNWRKAIKNLKIGEALPYLELETLEPDFVLSVKSTHPDNTKSLDFWCGIDGREDGLYSGEVLYLKLNTNPADLLKFVEEALAELEAVEMKCLSQLSASDKIKYSDRINQTKQEYLADKS